jgi:probable rRNA maturation factor
VSPVSPVVESFLGDIAIARGVARRQARVAGHSERTELRVLALHGLLHLLGYDHERDRGEMSRVEQHLRRRGGLREGLIERGQATRPSKGELAQDGPVELRARRR